MTESQFTQKIHKALRKKAPWLYVWKIRDTLAGGVADAYYSGPNGDMWIEYKYLTALPKRASTKIKTCLTEQQLQWLRARGAEGRAVFLVIGSPNGCLILGTKGCEIEGVNDITLADFIRSAVDIQQVISLITNVCGDRL